ncbi:CPW-WPC family protein [Plasmodium vivax]|uniref:CPW-WPC family protein n=1 Tax=Plasmodium vivax TaxID=5855 RepID=A0A1G4H5F9_PLAVI|nr:CPW-WPC family protein [Plasmodium vivax]
MAPSKLLPTVLLLTVLCARPPRVPPPFADAGGTGGPNVGGETGQLDDLSHFSRELLEPLARNLKSVPAVALREKVKTQVAKAAESLELPNPDEEACEINYAELCPEGWGDWGNADTCISPANYQGPCKNKMASFLNSTPREKFNFSIRCGVSWPCLHRCTEEDLLEECPDSWTLKGNICHAPKSYKGQCVRKKIFANFLREEKKAWADACDVSWPCSKKNYNFGKLCPKNWTPTPDGNHCSASSSYVGPCGPLLYLFNVKEVEKRLLMSKCNVEWPVRANEEGGSLDDQVCPLGWTLNPSHQRGGGTTCSPPKSYNGPCEEIKKMSFERMSKEEKHELSRRCGFVWNFTNERHQNFGLACPYNWVLVDAADHVCVSPVEYTQPCSNVASFKGYTHEMKAAWASRCKAPFVDEGAFRGGLQRGGSQTRSQLGSRLKKGKIFGLNREANRGGLLLADAPWERDGPIESATSSTHRSDCNAAIGEECLHNRDEPFVHPNGGRLPLSERSSEDHPHEFILSDQKITELLLLKQASEDRELRRNIDEVVQTLRRGHSPRGATTFSFLQVRSKGGQSSGATKGLKELARGAPTVGREKAAQRRRGADGETPHRKSSSDGEPPLHGQNAPPTAAAPNLSEVKNLYGSYQIGRADQSYYEHICLEKNYSECPLGWTRINTHQCMAPSWWRTNGHKCSSLIDLKDFTRRVYDVAHDMSFVSIDEERIKKLERKCALTFPCRDCERDYVQVSCPLGWNQTDDGWCEAPADYPPHLRAACGGRVNFKYATPLVRRNWSLVCRSDWPCFSPCEKNYAAVCPLGYGLINERLDAAGGGTIHVCVNRSWGGEVNRGEVNRGEVNRGEVNRGEVGRGEVNRGEVNRGEVNRGEVNRGEVNRGEVNRGEFNRSPGEPPNDCLVIEVSNSVQIKKQIERTCRVIWPCLRKCVQDYHQTCPYNWLLKQNKCIAPYHYSPPQGCAKSFAVRSFGSFDKYLFSNRCFAPWPCTDACQQDWSQPCPAHWSLVKSRKGKSAADKQAASKPLVCQPLKRNIHRGVCTDESYDLTDFTFLQKQEFSHRCGVRWPCGSSSRLYSPNWQSQRVYDDVGFQRLRTLRFYDAHYASSYAKSGTSFF